MKVSIPNGDKHDFKIDTFGAVTDVPAVSIPNGDKHDFKNRRQLVGSDYDLLFQSPMGISTISKS